MLNELREKITESRLKLKNPYAYLDGEGGFDAVLNEKKVVKAIKAPDFALLGNPHAYEWYFGNVKKNNKKINIKPSVKTRNLSKFEKVAEKIHKRMQEKNENLSNDILKLIDPSVVFNDIGYSVEFVDSLDHLSNESMVKIAGFIDPNKKQVFISTDFPKETQRFTLAHELGHALMHEGMKMHRDRPIDGSNMKSKRAPREYEADKFAVYFLMPEIQLNPRFQQLFLTKKFLLNENTIFALDPKGTQNIATNCKSLRDLSRILAKAEHYNGKYFTSLAKQFGVSVETMAIRLEELELINLSS